MTAKKTETPAKQDRKSEIASMIAGWNPKQKLSYLIKGVQAEQGRPSMKGSSAQLLRAAYQGYVSIQISNVLAELLRRKDPDNVSRAARRIFAGWEILVSSGARSLIKRFNDAQLGEIGEAYFHVCSAVKDKQVPPQADPRAAFAAADLHLEQDLRDILEERPLAVEELYALFDISWETALTLKAYDRAHFLNNVRHLASATES
jgi:hypothetical protein